MVNVYVCPPPPFFRLCLCLRLHCFPLRCGFSPLRFFFFCENLASFGCFVRRAVRKGTWRKKSVPLCPFFAFAFFFFCENLASFGCFVRRAVRKGIWRKKSVPLCPFSPLRFSSFAEIWRLSGVASPGRCEKAFGVKNLYPCALFRLCVFRFCENLASFGCFFRRPVRKRHLARKICTPVPFFRLCAFLFCGHLARFGCFFRGGGAKKTSGVTNLYPCALLRKKKKNVFGFVFCFVLYLCTHFCLLCQLEVVLERSRRLHLQQLVLLYLFAQTRRGIVCALGRKVKRSKTSTKDED